MAALSKEIFNRNIQHLTCHQAVHTWSKSCVESWCIFVSHGSKGIFKFFFLMYLAQLLLMRKKLSKKKCIKLFRDYLSSVLYGHAVAFLFSFFNCAQYKLFGRLSYNLTVYGTGIFSSLASVITPKYRIDIEATCFCIMSLECWLRHLSYERILPRNKYAGTPLFMLCNGIMMLLLWKKCNTNKSLNTTWIFKPYTEKELCDNKLCCHHGSCLSDCVKVSTKYFLIGLGISAMKLLIKKIKKPQIGFLKLFSTSYLVDPVFLWTYVLLQKAVHCFLTQIRGEDCQEHAFAAGLISGMSYLIQPNLSIPSSSSILIIKTLFDRAKENYSLPDLPYQYLMYMVGTAFLMHFSMINKRLVPAFFIETLNQGSYGRSGEVFNNFKYLGEGGTPIC